MTYVLDEKYDYINEFTVKTLVDNFYQRIRKDKKLGTIFNNVIGESDEKWKPHMEVMYSFWSSIVLTKKSYNGHPVEIHKKIPTFDPELFDSWLSIFAETAKDLHTDGIVAIYIEKSTKIDQSLKLALYYKP